MSDRDFREGLARHLAALRRYALLLARDQADADDLVQECLAKALAAADTWRPGSDLRVWLFRILYTTFVSERRRRDVRERHAGAAPDAAAEGAGEPGQLLRLEVADLLAALDELPAQQREVVVMVAMDDVRYADAAGRLGIPVGTFMSRLARGREALRQALEGNRRPRLRLVRGDRP